MTYLQYITAPEQIGLRYFLDVRFASNASSTIVASRAVVQAEGLVNWNDDAILMSQVRDACSASSFKAVPFMEYFVFFDQVSMIFNKPLTISIHALVPRQIYCVHFGFFVYSSCKLGPRLSRMWGLPQL